MSKREHLDQLAAELNLPILYGSVPRYRGALDRASWVVYLPEWDEHPDETYWVGLHELGHAADLGPVSYADFLIFGDPADRGEPLTPSFTAAEARAWAWAIEHALPEAFPLGQVGESNIAWSITDYMHGHGWEPSPEFELIYRTVGEEPDWFYDVTTPAHYAKLDGWARPMWAELRAHYEGERALDEYVDWYAREEDA